MNIDSIKNGIVIDHIRPGESLELYRMLGLDSLDCQVAIIKNTTSGKMGRKDIIKVAADIDIDLDVLGYIDPNITVNIIRDGELVEKRHVELPKKLTNILRCKNPRCITTIEQDLDQVFLLTDADRRVYRCLYCETQASQD